MDPDPERGRLGEQDPREVVGLVRMAERGEHESRTVFFHLGGGEKDIEGTGLEKPLHRGGRQFGGDVVEVGLDLGDLVGLRGFRLAGLPEHRAEDIRARRRLAGSQPVARALDPHFAHRAEAHAEFRQQGRSGRGDEFGFLGHLAERHPCENLERRGRGERETPVGALQPARALDRHRRLDAQRPERVDARAGGHDVRDRIRRPDLMEFHLPGGNPVDLPFGNSDPVKD